jgi:PTH1 family peptidyl-tRNA hydrolase
VKRVLVVGLGNEGSSYKNTRHNIGFSVLDYFAQEIEGGYSSGRYANTANFRKKGVHFFLVKPTTFMNLSGNAVRYWLQKHRIDLKNLLVITDDIHLPFGTIRIKPGGSDGGHNGIKHINETLKTSIYPRLRFGIGGNFEQGCQSDYVLSQWAPKEQQQLPDYIKICTEAIFDFGTVGIQKTMSLYNKKSWSKELGDKFS